MTTKAERDAPLMGPDERADQDVKSKHAGGSTFKAGSLALGEFEDPWDPSRAKQGHVLDWTPNERKSRAGRKFNRRMIHTYATTKDKITMDWIPLMFGPTAEEDPNENGPKPTLRDMVYKMQEESPLEMIPMEVKTYVRWDGVKDFNIANRMPAFMPDALEVLTCGSERENDDFVQMGRETLKLAELLIMGTAIDHIELKNKTRKDPLLGFQVPRSLPMTGGTCTGRTLSDEIIFEKTSVEARSGIKLHSMWEVKQTLVVKEHQLEDPDIGMYMIPVLHIETIISKISIGADVPIIITYRPDKCEVNALWIKVHSEAAAIGMRATWTADEPWKLLIWNKEDPRLSDERKEHILEQSRSLMWRREVLGNMSFMISDRTKKFTDGTCNGAPIVLMLVEERAHRKSARSGERESKRSNNNEQCEPNKRHRIGHENLLEAGSVEEAKGVASGSSDGRSSA